MQRWIVSCADTRYGTNDEKTQQRLPARSYHLLPQELAAVRGGNGAIVGGGKAIVGGGKAVDDNAIVGGGIAADNGVIHLALLRRQIAGSFRSDRKILAGRIDASSVT